MQQLRLGAGKTLLITAQSIADPTRQDAVAAIAGVLVFSSSQQHLFDDPRLYGWAWDVQVGDAFAPALDDLADDLRDDPRAEAVSLATVARLTIGDQAFDALAIDADSGIVPTTTDGTPVMTSTKKLTRVSGSSTWLMALRFSSAGGVMKNTTSNTPTPRRYNMNEGVP